MSRGSSWPADFLDAHERHWEDAELLFSYQRLANADHLYGLSAECGLKAIMVKLGIPTDPQGSPLRPYRAHIDDLWNKFLTFVNQPEIRQYFAALPSKNPFADWAVEQRYAHRKKVLPKRVIAHQKAAGQVHFLVKQVKLNGILP